MHLIESSDLKRSMLISFLSFIFLLSNYSLQAQQHDHRNCGTDAYMEVLMQDEKFRRSFEKNKELIREKVLMRKSMPCTTPLIIPVAVHYNTPITTANTACLIEAAEKQVNQMNLDFSSCNANAGDFCDWLDVCPAYFSDPNGGDVMPEDGVCIQFCLGDINLPAGEDNIGGLAITVGDYTWPSVSNNNWDGFMNIFVSNEATAGQASGTLGIAPLNGAANPSGNGFWVLYTTFGAADFSGCTSGGTIGNNTTFNGGATSTHEAGHYFGLQHTFSDALADTPPQTSPNFGCPNPQPSDCPSTPVGNDYGWNFMDYVDDECMSIFSADQADVMVAVAAAQTVWAETSVSCYAEWTGGTLTYNSCVGECDGDQPPVANFNPADGSVLDFCDLGDINFSDSSTGSPTSWSWSFAVASGDLVIGSSSSTSQNPVVALTSGTSGTLDVDLTATNGFGSDTKSHTITINVAPCTSICDVANVNIPDNNTTGVSRTINIGSSGTITDVNIDIDISHTWVGDVKVTIEHLGTVVTLLDQPGVPSSTFGCAQDDILCTFDDESVNGTVESVCPSATPTYTGDYNPETALSAFDGLDQAGDWVITVSDLVADFDGTLNEWCITPTTDPGMVDCLTMAELVGDVTGIEDYESQDYIESVQTLISGSSVDYDAAESILLDIGFECKAGAAFEAFINGCNNGGGGINLQGSIELDDR